MSKLILTFAVLGATAVLSGCAHHNNPTGFTYVDRPVGYDWKARKDPNNGATVYYGVDPANGATVYVGPDDAYYEFNHSPPIQPGDLRAVWDPRNS